ncbi:hypothetical protein VP01_3988g2, partial [Puccinia sorghi]
MGNYPGAWVEEHFDYRCSDTSGNKETSKSQEKEPEKEEKLGGGLRKKILEKISTLMLEELLPIAPKSIQELQNFSKEEVKVMEHSQNMGRFNRSNFNKELYRKRVSPITWKVTYKRNQYEYHGDWRSFFSSTENSFIVCGKFYIVLGQPFLADHKVRLELSQARGEIPSYKLWDGGRLCIPICSPEVPGWEIAPPQQISMGKIKELSPMVIGEEYTWIPQDLYEKKSHAYQWSTGEDEEPWLNWNPEWAECKAYNVTYMESKLRMDWEQDLDYGFPRGHFLQIYPETHGSRAEGIGSEFPGYMAGRIGFMMILEYRTITLLEGATNGIFGSTHPLVKLPSFPQGIPLRKRRIP